MLIQARLESNQTEKLKLAEGWEEMKLVKQKVGRMLRIPKILLLRKPPLEALIQTIGTWDPKVKYYNEMIQRIEYKVGSPNNITGRNNINNAFNHMKNVPIALAIHETALQEAVKDGCVGKQR